MKKLFLLPVVALVFISCRKDNVLPKADNCGDLKKGIASDNALLVKSAINNYIDALPSNLHTSFNLTSLTAYISQNCTEAVVVCHGCIYTYPAQSEIVITVDSAGTPVKRVVDITGLENEKMRYIGMHRYN